MSLSGLSGAPTLLDNAEFNLDKLRILVVHNVLGKRNGGMSRLMGFIHDMLIPAGHTVDYFCADDVSAAVNGRAARFTFPLLALRKAISASRSGNPYDLINVHEPSGSALSLFKRAAGDPALVVTSHGLEIRAWQLALEELRLGRQGPSLKSRLIYPLTSLWQSKVALQRADHVLCLNSEDRDYLMQRLGLPKTRITRIFPGADKIFASAAKKRDYSRGDRLLFAATWRKNKGVEDLVPAFTTLANSYSDVKLCILGGGLPEPEMLAAFPEAVRQRISCVPAQDDVEIARVFADSDIYVLPSLFEGTPLTLVEAMMSGLPIVTTAVCGMKDLIQDEKNGLLVPIRSPSLLVKGIERLMKDRASRSRLGRAAQQEALGSYTWEKAAIPVHRRYLELCGNLKGRRYTPPSEAHGQAT